MGFPCVSAGKESACNVGDLAIIPGLGRSPREGKGYPLQDSGLEKSMDCIVHGVVKSRTQLGDLHFPFIRDTPYFLKILFCICIQSISNVVMVSGERQRDSATPVHVSTLPKLPS